MNQRQQSLRYAATRAFMESLDQLQETLQPADQSVPPTPPENSSHRNADAPLADQFDLNSLEQAVADIEQFMQKRQQDGEE
jgi:hypothetical protein